MSNLTPQERQVRIRELKQAIEELEAGMPSEMDEQQHEKIDELEQYFDAVETKFTSLKIFWEDLKQSLKNSKQD
ncbi:hypothetical protein [Methylophaga sp.]|uniref:hypothetical protein n=1 Tax=Methylophaga sp. TaxID=2024840 RepID=UPI002719220E|nr:hypothetical protein [Methylophaga sp.]MDO8825805.1 hypothetical protein [Methylophaga sp.]